MSDFFNQSYISIDQITHLNQVKALFKVADKMKTRIEEHSVYEPLAGMSVAVLFYQPSTRTFSSFVAAAKRLGAYVTAIHGMEEYSSVSKGESLEDTIRSIYHTTAADAIVLRHPDNNSSQIAAEVSPVPIINAGSGTLEHPSQALLDLYTIYEHHGRLENLHVVMVGDLLYGRTIKSLAKLLALGKKNKITFVSPQELKAPPELIDAIKSKVTVAETDKLNGSLAVADVVYMTRVQKEWFAKAGKMDEYERMKDRFILTRHLVSQMKKKAIVMHPLPRVGEILHEVDEDPRAKYFEQMRSGLYVRMALLESILCR
ncbi:MAG TPA: aspartate carbamoyltransferase [Patescibacteria group bacterium]